MRAALSAALVRFAQNNPKAILLTGDHGYALFDEFRKSCPGQYVNAGIAEQNMVGMAAGLSRAGFHPIVYGLSAFVPVRVLEQIKIDICHDNLPAVFLGDGAGLVYSSLGTSHQSCEDIACLRAIPSLTMLSPADRFEMTAVMDYAEANPFPTYIRIGKADRGDIHSGPLSLAPGRLLPITGSGDLAFIATGSMVKTAVNLAADFPGASVWSVPFIKPLDEQQVLSIAAQSRIIVTLEEHSTYGGLGAAIAEILSESRPTLQLRIGVADRFSEYCGSYDYLLREHGLDQASVKRKIKDYLKRHGYRQPSLPAT